MDNNDDGNGDYNDYDQNNNADNAGDGAENVDQYFDDAGDIGYLPADHVTLPLIVNPFSP